MAAVAVLVCNQTAGAQGGDVRSISVNGHAEIRLVPDLVVITLGVETFDMDLDVAKRDNDDRATRLIQVAESLGVDRQDIRTEFLNIQPQFKSHQDHGNFLRYLVRKTVTITLRDVSKYEALLTSLLGAGANYVHGIEFLRSELDRYRLEARALAIKAAQSKAEDMAKQFGVRLGKPHSIRESQSHWRSSYGRWGQFRDHRRQQNTVQTAESVVEPIEGPTQPGQISLMVTVGVSFYLLD